jgi:DNA-binding transcriptional ArsR family regulator
MLEAVLSSVFAALSDPTRRHILERLGQGDATVSELAEPFEISLPAISRHLKVLESAGLISRGRRAQWRTSSLRTGPLDDIGDWMEHVRQIWATRLDRLDAHLHEMKRLNVEADKPKLEQEQQHA